MSISVDDLVSSLQANHIGQEAIDLADLQAQLAQSLYYQSQHHQQPWASPTAPPAAAPCNTPTARTPSSTFSWSMHDIQRRQRSSSSASSSSWRAPRDHDMGMGIAEEDMMEADDEDAVEQMVQTTHYSGTSSPVRHRHDSLHTTSSPIPLNSHAHGRVRHDSLSDPSPAHVAYSSSDPFFAAAEAASRSAFHPQQSDFFAQNARPTQHSPFYTAQGQQNAFSHSLAIDTRPRFLAAGGLNA